MDLTPIFRKEFFLDAIIKGTTPPEPIFREEFFLAKIAGADVETPTPIFRIEKYLAKIGGEDVEIPDPVFREEYWLAKKCGEDVTTPTPVFRLEYFLEEWVNGSAPAYQSVTGKIVSFLTQRIAPLKIEATLSPIQDLHGYDSPWPPGGGVNKYSPCAISKTSGTPTVSTSGDEYTINGEPTGYGQTISSDYVTLPAGDYYFKVFTISGTGNVNPQLRNSDGSTTYASGGSPTFTLTESTNIYPRITWNEGTISNLKIKLMIVSGSTAPTAYSPYSNECPISGHTGADVNVNGINLFDKSAVTVGKWISDETGAIADSASYSISNYISVVPGETYYKSASGSSRCLYYDADKNVIYTGSWAMGSGAGTFTVPSNARYIRYTVKNDNVDSFTVNYPSTDHDYHAYSGTTVTITFGQTVYGCQLTVFEDGTGSVKARPYYASYNGETLVGPWVSSMDAYAPGTTPTTGAQVVDMGGTETTIPLTPGQVNALQGQNVVWVDDSSEIKVTYRSN